MEPAESLAPPVVAVMVVREPGPWFAETLASLARQDYANLRCLFLVVGAPGDLPTLIRETVPNAFVRAVGGNPGFGNAANEVLRLVEGENGFFCLLHDDVALEPSTIRMLVEELYRSNAGIVGPKLVEWSRPRVLQHVGVAVDRFGEIDPLVEPGEIDQEQHDAVRDVFAVPTACLLVRADLFRTLGGFDATIEYRGDDVDLCWRAHLSGARVVVVPATRVRHLEQLAERRPDLALESMQARARMRSVATLTSARRLWFVAPQLFVVTVAEALVALVTGRVRRAGSVLASLGGLIARSPALLARRRQVAPLREVPYGEVAGLQERGSARLTAFVRSRASTVVDPDAADERRWRETAGSAPVVTWLVTVALFVLGSRGLLLHGVPAFGQFLGFPASPRGLWSTYASGWSGFGLGTSAPNPTGLGLVAVGSVATLFHMGLLHTLGIVGLLLVGALGAWRLGSIFAAPRARITALAVYGLVPLPSQLLSAGRWAALVVYAALPWCVHLMRRSAGLDSAAADPAGDLDGEQDVDWRRRVRYGAQLALVIAVSMAFAPATPAIVVVVALAFALATLFTGRWQTALGLAGTTVAAVVAALIVNLPWTGELLGSDGWTAIVGPPGASARELGVSTLSRFHLGNGRLVVLAVALYLPVVVAPMVARSWRFAWSVRAAVLVSAFGVLVVLDDRGSVPFRLPEPGMLLVPVALGVAVSAGCLVSALETDVLRGSFGWRQPLALLATTAIVVGVLPGAIAVGNGRWNMPERTLQSVYAEFPTSPKEGDYRILWIGAPETMPVAAWTYQPGIAYAITDDGPLDITDGWGRPPTVAEGRVARALRQMAAGVTVRGGRLLAPYAIRYIVVPVADGFNGTIAHPLPVAAGLLDVLDDQLDLAAPLTSPPNYRVYENTAYTPTRATLSAEGAAASTLAGDEAVTSTDLTGSIPFAVGAPDRGPATGDVPAGVLHVAVPYESSWVLRVDGSTVAGRRAFGSTLAFDVATPGHAMLRYSTPGSRTVVLAVQVALWLALALLASRVNPGRWFRRRRDRGVLDDHSVVADLRAPMPVPMGDDADAEAVPT